jgi:hypothetical protein
MMATTKTGKPAKKSAPPKKAAKASGSIRPYTRSEKWFASYHAEPFGRRGTIFEGAWRDLAEAYGGVTALANELGCSYQTLLRWATRDAYINPTAQKMIAILAAQKGLPSPVKPE